MSNEHPYSTEGERGREGERERGREGGREQRLARLLVGLRIHRAASSCAARMQACVALSQHYGVWEEGSSDCLPRLQGGAQAEGGRKTPLFALRLHARQTAGAGLQHVPCCRSCPKSPGRQESNCGRRQTHPLRTAAASPMQASRPHHHQQRQLS